MSGLNNSERQLLQQLVTRLNLIEQNAKKIDELPLKSTLNGNDLLHISENGTSKKITMSNLLDIVQNRSFDHLVSVINMQLIGNQFSVESATWEISSILNTLSFPFLQNIPYSASGMLRRDIVVGNTNNELVYIQGEENEGISFAPPIPPSTVFITEFDVTDNSVNNSQPIIGDNFKKKIESSFSSTPNVGVMQNIAMNIEHGNLFITNATEVKSLYFGDLFNAYAGKEIKLIYNGTGILQITHNASGADVYSKFIFPYGDNYFMLPNEVLTFIVSSDLNILIFVSSNRRFGQSKVINSSVTLDNSYHGRTLIINGNLTITYPAPNTLHPEFEVCIMTLAYNLTNTPNAAWDVNAPNGRNMVHNKIAYVKRIGTTLFFRGEVNV